MPHPEPLREAAPAKLNLWLHITGKRPDGYHLLESLAAFTQFGDSLEFEPGEELRFHIDGPYAPALRHDDDNLVMRAARMLQECSGCRLGAHITLHKHIPVGAGLGGGSADAAAALRGLARLWNLDLSSAQMQAMALALGSDVPVCMASRPAWMRGVGEDVTPIDMAAPVGVLLANPGAPLLTADVFRCFSGHFAPQEGKPAAVASSDALIDLLKPRRNMLEEPAIACMPVIADLLTAISATSGCLISRMSGSGATCFGLYAHIKDAHKAAIALKQQHPRGWFVATELL